VTKHYTLGGTYELSKDTQVTASYMYAPENSVTGDGLFNGFPGYTPVGATDKIRMSQQSLGLQFGWKF
jgi:long-chain fatty acid transport protein